MRAAVADASPLRYLVLIGAIEILPRLFEGVFVPDIVRTPNFAIRMRRLRCAVGRNKYLRGSPSYPLRPFRTPIS
jgi:hypothetical protein